VFGGGQSPSVAYRGMLVICPLLTLQHVAMHIGNHRVGVRGIALNIGNGGVHVRDTIANFGNSYVRIYYKLGLGMDR